MSKTVLVTGGAGYIGSHVCHQLQQAGFQPVVLDNLSRGHRFALRDLPFVEGDIADDNLIISLCDRYRPTALMHFAGYIEVAESVKQPEKYFDNNHRKAEALFHTAKARGIQHVIFSSTAAVYGTPVDAQPIKETAALQPINPYGESKLRAEQALARSGLSHVILRYFNAAGALPEANLGEAHWPETHLIPRAILAALGQVPPLQLFGTDYPTADGSAVRDYIHVLDLAAAHIKALLYLQQGRPNAVCNLGGSKGHSVKEVLHAIGHRLHKPVPYELAARRAGDPPALVADISLAQRLLGWQPRLTLQDIIASAVAWHKGDLYRKSVLASRV